MEIKQHLQKVLAQDEQSHKNEEPQDDYKYITATTRKLKDIAAREKQWKAQQRRRPGGTDARSKYLSNQLHYSPTDPDARVAVKPGKRRQLCYAAQIAAAGPGRHTRTCD